MNIRPLLPFLLAAFQQTQSQKAARLRPTGGHRAKRYTVTQYDLDRIQRAAERRDIKAAKRHQDYQKCLANNPCLK